MIPTMDESARQYDLNGWFEVPDNPISREGVFPYSGGQIGAPERGRIYQVYRPAGELADPETLASFRLVPIIDDHTMLGRGQKPVEDVGAHGVIGENIQVADGVMTANLKIFSSKLAEKIKSGKTELSCGYRCVYDFTPGEWNGQRYDAVQRQIRGNHLALVDEGRMGPSVAILDQMTFTVDAKEQGQTMDEELKKVLEAIAAQLATMASAIAELKGAKEEVVAKVEGEDEEAAKAKDAEEAAAKTGDEEPAKAKDAEEAAAKAKDEEKTGMDALTKTVKDLASKVSALPVMDEAALTATIAKKNTLAATLAKHVGTFDHASMTHAQVVKYGVEKLGLKDVPAGSEAIALDAALQVRALPQPFTTATDAKETGLGKSVADHYAKGAK